MFEFWLFQIRSILGSISLGIIGAGSAPHSINNATSAAGESSAESSGANIDRSLRSFLIVALVFLIIIEFCVQFTLSVGFAFIFLKLLKIQFIWYVSGVLFLHFLLFWFINFPNMIKFLNWMRANQNVPPMTARDIWRFGLRSVASYMANLLITIVVLVLAAVIVRPVDSVGVPQLAEMLLEGSYRVLGVALGTFFIFIFSRLFLIPLGTTGVQT